MTLRERRIDEFDTAAKNLGSVFWEVLKRTDDDIKCSAREIRIRLSRPIQIYTGDKSYFVSRESKTYITADRAGGWVDKKLLQTAVQSLTSYSMHTHQNELASGFISTVGGGRVGIGATAVYENGIIKSVRDITSVSVRISREFHGCADELLKKIHDTSGGILIAGEPGCGKTTLLRELCRKLADGENGSIALLDERMEIAAISSDGFSHDVGVCCDVLSGYKKSDAMQQAVRTLSPSFIICDEIGCEEDVLALKSFVNSGVRMIATVHAGDSNELLMRKTVRDMLKTGAFSSVAIMYRHNVYGKMGQIRKFMDIKELNELIGGELYV